MDKFILLALGCVVALLVPDAAKASSACEEKIVALTWQCMGQSLTGGDASGCRRKAEQQANCDGASNSTSSQPAPQAGGPNPPVAPKSPLPTSIAKTPSSDSPGQAPKCRSPTSARDCVTLEQRGISGRWHNYRLVNACDGRFNVPIFSCNAEWAGGCSVAQQAVGPCQTTGSVTEGKQSWDQDAQPRW
jgi:hypothetical protein